MKFLIFQHARVEHPAIFREFFAADGIDWHAIELDEGEPIPSLDGFDALMAFGGPMDVWQESAHPWLVAEKAAIRSWVCERRKPYLSICLGHQLLADALGGTVRKMDVPEIGVCEVTLNSAGASALLFRDLPLVIPVLQWHGAAVERVPAFPPPFRAWNPTLNVMRDPIFLVRGHRLRRAVSYGANRVHDPGVEPDSGISGIARADRRSKWSAAFRTTNY